MGSFIKRKNTSPSANLSDSVQDSQKQAEAAATAQSYSLMVPEVRTVNLENIKIQQSVLTLIPENIALANKMLPLYLTDRGTTLVVAMADPRNDDAINNIGVYIPQCRVTLEISIIMQECGRTYHFPHSHTIHLQQMGRLRIKQAHQRICTS